MEDKKNKPKTDHSDPPCQESKDDNVISEIMRQLHDEYEAIETIIDGRSSGISFRQRIRWKSLVLA
jgi:hypothetical protein